MEAILAFLLPLIQTGVEQYPVIATIIFVIGAVRIVMKPLMTTLEAVVNLTPSTADNALLDKVLSSKVYKAVVFALDLILSIKLPNKSG